ncbi:MAG: rRNA maturation RNAse YbeY [Segetibacter sp.]
MPSVRFNYADVKPIALNKKSIIKEMVADIFLHEGKTLKLLDYIFCSDNYLLDLNNAFLHHNFFTDIISFDLSEGEAIVGEVYISVERVKENALLHSVSFKRASKSNFARMSSLMWIQR